MLYGSWVVGRGSRVMGRGSWVVGFGLALRAFGVIALRTTDEDFSHSVKPELRSLEPTV